MILSCTLLRRSPSMLGAVAFLTALLVPVYSLSAQPNTPLEKLRTMAKDTVTPPDLAEAALLASQMIQPSVTPDTYLANLDVLADALRPVVGPQTPPLEAAAAMGQFFYEEKEFANSTVQSADVFVGLDQVLDRKQWNCVGMSLLYVTVGKRLGFPLQVAAGYGHVLVGHPGTTPFFIETTARGGLQPTRAYLLDYLPFPCVNPDGYGLLDERGAIAMTLTQMALVMQHEQRVQLAGTLFDLAIEFSDSYAEAYAGRGFLRAAAGDPVAAGEDFERAIALEPGMREAYGGLGTAYRAQGSLARAVESYRTLVSLCPDDSAAVFNTGQLLYESGDYEGAVYAFRHYITLEPRDPEGYMRLAFPLEDGGDLAGAAQAYQQVLQLAPNYVDAIVNLSLVLEQMQNYEASLTGYRRALAIQPNNVRAMGGLGRLLGIANRYDEALRTFRMALQLYPGEAFLWVDLGRLFENVRDLKQAIGAYQEATRADPGDPEGYYALARVLQQAGFVEDAQRAVIQARRIEADAADRGVAGTVPPVAVNPGSVGDLFSTPAPATSGDDPVAGTDGAPMTTEEPVVGSDASDPVGTPSPADRPISAGDPADVPPAEPTPEAPTESVPQVPVVGEDGAPMVETPIELPPVIVPPAVP